MLHFEKKEIKELVLAWFLLTIAFTIMLSNVLSNGFEPIMITIFIISAVTAGLGFILHELGHKLVAERYGCITEFIANKNMLGLAILLSLFGFIIAAPGGVHIKGTLNKARLANIAAAGPLANLLLVVAFIPTILFSTGIIQSAAIYGFSINAWLGLFNMIPAQEFDGYKILQGHKTTYYILAIALLIPSLISFIFF